MSAHFNSIRALKRLDLVHEVGGLTPELVALRAELFEADLRAVDALANLPLGPLPTGVWTKVTLAVDFGAGTVSADLNGGTPVSSAIAPSAVVDPSRLRFCYRGEGEGNIATLLLDDMTLGPIGLSSLSISPSSGSLIQAQSVDLVLNLNAADVTATGGTVRFDGVDITDQFNPSLDFAALSAGGTIQLPNAGTLLTPGRHILSVDINLSDQTTVSDEVLWNIVPAPNPVP